MDRKTRVKRPRKSQDEILADGMAFDMQKVVKRYARDNDIPIETALRHEKELKRYLILCAIHPYSRYGMRGQVDELWHTLVFHTKDYFAFCETIAGRYIHHVPEDPDEPAAGTARKPSTYGKMLAAYSLVFGEAPPDDIWPKIGGRGDGASSLDTCGDSCDRCGDSCDSCGSGCNSCNGGCSGCNRCGPD